uniref:uncharacterized protein isoform X2 n=1 Tax=Myxine glutinosa TaxID=7769 RepID=UPI00358F832B
MFTKDWEKLGSWKNRYCNNGWTSTLHQKMMKNVPFTILILIVVCTASCTIIQIMLVFEEFLQQRKAIHRCPHVNKYKFQELFEVFQKNQYLKFQSQAQQFNEVHQRKDCAQRKPYKMKMEDMPKSTYFRGTEVVPSRFRSTSPTGSGISRTLHLRGSLFEPPKASPGALSKKSNKGKGPQKMSHIQFKRVSPASLIGSSHSSSHGKDHASSVKGEKKKEKCKVQTNTLKKESKKEKVQAPGKAPQKNSDIEYKRVSLTSFIASAHSSSHGKDHSSSVKGEKKKEKCKVQPNTLKKESKKEKVQAPGKAPQKKSDIEYKRVSPASSLGSLHSSWQGKGYVSSVKEEPKKEKSKVQQNKFQKDLEHQRHVQLPCEAHPKKIQDSSSKSCGMRLGSFQKASPYFYEAHMDSDQRAESICKSNWKY